MVKAKKSSAPPRCIGRELIPDDSGMAEDKRTDNDKNKNILSPALYRKANKQQATINIDELNKLNQILKQKMRTSTAFFAFRI